MEKPYRDGSTVSLPKRGWSEFFHPKKWNISRLVTSNKVPFLEGSDGTIYRRNLKPYKTTRKRSIFECQHRKDKRCNAQYEEYVSHLGIFYYRKYKNSHSCKESGNKMVDEEQHLGGVDSGGFPRPGISPQVPIGGGGNFGRGNNNQEGTRNMVQPPPQTTQPMRSNPSHPHTQLRNMDFRDPNSVNLAQPRFQEPQRRQRSQFQGHHLRQRLVNNMRNSPPSIHRFFPEKGSPRGNNLVDIYCSFGVDYNNWIFQGPVNPSMFIVRFGDTPAAKVIEVNRSHLGRLSHQMSPLDHQNAAVMILVRDFPHPPGHVKISVKYPVRGGATRLITSRNYFVYEELKVKAEVEIEGEGEILEDGEDDEVKQLFPAFGVFEAPSKTGDLSGGEDVSADEDLFYWNNENVDPFGFNLLLYSCSKNLANVRYLVEEKNFRLDVTDNFGNGVLHVASYFKKLDIYDYLLYQMISQGIVEEGSDISPNCFGFEAIRPEQVNRGKMSRLELKMRTQITQITNEIKKTEDECKRLEYIFLRGRKHFDIKDYELAVEDFETCIHQDLNLLEKVRGHYGKGNIFQSLNEPKLAIEEYDKSLELDSKCSEAYYGKGLAFKKLKMLKEAYDNFSNSIVHNDRLAYSYYERAVILHRFGENDRAIDDYSKCLDIYPEFVQALNGRGNVYRALSRSNLALADYQEALRINEGYVHAFNGRANVFLDVGDLEKAKKNYQQCLKINTRYVYAYYGLGNVAVEEKDYEMALQLYEKCVGINPHYVLAKKKMEEVRKLIDVGTEEISVEE